MKDSSELNDSKQRFNGFKHVRNILSRESCSSILKILKQNLTPEQNGKEHTHYPTIHEKLINQHLENVKEAKIDLQQLEQVINSYEQLEQNLQQLNQEIMEEYSSIQITQVTNVQDGYYCTDVTKAPWYIREDNMEITEDFEYLVVSKSGTYIHTCTTQATIEAYIQQTENRHTIKTL